MRTRPMRTRRASKLAGLCALGLAETIVAASPARAEIRVFACEPEWAALAVEIGGARVTAFSATHARQDPHHIRARPSLIARIRQADLLFCSGGGLEVGWLPILLRRGALEGVQPGRVGHLMAVDHVTVREMPPVLDRALGDLHPEGNPHVHLDARNMLPIARELARRLTEIDPAHASSYDTWLRAFESRWQTALARWQVRLDRIKGMNVIVHHKSWTYFMAWAGLVEAGTLEPKPGIAPTASHLEQLLRTARARPVAAILRTPFDAAEASAWLAARTGIPALLLPFTVDAPERQGALETLFDDILTAIEGAGRVR